MENDFLPKDYEVPNTSPYMRFEEGKNRFRILKGFGTDPDSGIMGTEYWVTVDGKRRPRRLKMGVATPVGDIEINPTTGEMERPKHFWALPVYNYASKSVQILEITQKGIMRTIEGLSDDSEWGSPVGYDLTVNRSEDSGKTSYTVVPSPKKEIEPVIKEGFVNQKLNIKALFDGGDPFTPVEPLPEPGELIDVDEVSDALEALKGGE